MTKPGPTINDILEVIGDLSSAMAAGFEDLRTDLKGNIHSLQHDVTGMKADVATLKTDMAGLKQDMTEVKKDIRQMKEDIAELKGITAAHEDDIREVYATLSRIEAKLEVSESDRIATKARLESLIVWAQDVAKHLDIPLSVK